MNSKITDLHLDSNLFSALGHALDDQERFLSGCMQFAERNYESVRTWFVREFDFLSNQDSEDALHEFFVTLSCRLMGESPQAKLNEFKQNGDSGRLSFFLYLKQIARNAARDFVRSRRRLEARESSVASDELETRLVSLIEQVIFSESDTMLHDIRQQSGINDRDWKVFVSSLELRAAELSQSTGLTSAAIYVINCRVRKKLQEVRSQILEKYGMIGRLIIADADHLSFADHPTPPI